jgi:uncharacterized protein YdiU (UPF0061 family)
MISLKSLPFNNTFSHLSELLFTRVQPQNLEQPFLVSINPQTAQILGISPKEFKHPDVVNYFSGNVPLPGSEPVAMVYAGHQFGGYSPQLGDGRGLLLGEVETQSNGRWDIHLKGAGKTPYSRFGDGRAVLRSSIREYLCSEAMAGLGIATTRALCIIGSHTTVDRERVETAATLTRIARSHIRFGHFEYFHYNSRPDIVKELADYVISEHHPDINNPDDNRYSQWLSIVAQKTAELIAHWQAVGFAHGVMNTDNMSIIGDTLDYGPFGFLDDYKPAFICNHSDHQGRYSFNRQPSIGLWNLNALAHSLSSLMDTNQISEALALYEPTITTFYEQLMREKIGLKQHQPNDNELIDSLLSLLEQQKYDYTLFFRQLSRCDVFDSTATHSIKLRDSFVDRQGFDNWIERYKKRLQEETQVTKERQACMLQVNPKYILRTYLAHQAINKATLEQDYSEIDQLLLVLQSPYDEHPDYEDYAKPPPDWGKEMAVSCSS